ncbi:MAG: hypothetical protein GMKNLPBB_02570 [Myxococcota bacterium]|nr:hypothetical protein [Myxococcota bacterium]
MRRIDWVLMAILAIAAGFFRFFGLEWMEFKLDEADALALTLEFVRDGKPPVTGLMSSVGVYNPPAFLYLLAPAAFLNPDPLFVAAFVGLCNVAAVVLTYHLARRLFSTPAAFSAALLFAVNPWAVLYSRKIWAQDLLPLFTVIVLYCLIKVASERLSYAAIGLFPALCLVWQIHFSGYVALAVTAGSLALFHRRGKYDPGAFINGVLLAIGLLVPYIVHLIRTRGEDIVRMLSIGKGESPGSSVEKWTPARLEHAFDLLTSLGSANGFHYNGEVPSAAAGVLPAGFETPANQGMAVILGVGFFALLALGFLRVRKIGSERIPELSQAAPYWISAFWLAAPFLVFGLTRLKIFPHYFIIAYPAHFLAIGAILYSVETALFRRRSGSPERLQQAALTAILMVPVLLIAVWWTDFNWRVWKELKHAGGLRGDYGVAYIHKLRLVKAMAARGSPRSTIELHERHEIPFLFRMIQEELPANPAMPRYRWSIHGLHFEPVDATDGCAAIVREGPLLACGR